MRPNHILALLLVLSLSNACHAVLLKNQSASGFNDALAVNATEISGPAANVTSHGRIGAQWFKAIAEEMNEGRFDAAIALCNKYLKEAPKSGLLYELKGIALFHKGEMNRALQAFTNATRVEPNQNGPWTKRGIIEMENAELTKAERSLKKAISLHANDRFAHQRLGMLYDYQSKTALAIHHYQQGLRGTSANYLGIALPLARLLNDSGQAQRTIDILAPKMKNKPGHREGQQLLASAYLLNNDALRAKKHFQNALSENQHSKSATLGLAIAERKLDRLQASKRLTDKLVNMTPPWAPAFQERGEWYLTKNDTTSAYKALRRAGKLTNNPSYADKRMAQYYVDAGNKARAKEYFQKAVATKRAVPDTYTRYAELLLSLGEIDKGEQILSDGIKQYPDNPALKFRKAAYQASTRQYNKAVASFEALKKAYPKDPKVLHALTLAYSRLGNAESAASNARLLHEMSPDNKSWAMLYGSTSEKSGNRRVAEKTYRSLLQTDENYAPALNNLAVLLSDNGDLNNAEELARKALKNVPESAQIKDTLGWILFQQGDTNQAIILLRNAAKATPSSANMHYHLGMALAKSGDSNGAKKALNRALSLEPKAPWLAKAQAQLKAL